MNVRNVSRVCLSYFHRCLLTAFLKVQQLMMDSEMIFPIMLNAVGVMHAGAEGTQTI